MIKNIDRIETQLRELFERKLVRIFTGKHQSANLIEALVDVMQKNLEQQQDGGTIAPDLYVIQIPPEDLDEWQSHQDILDQIAASLLEIGHKEGFVFQNVPEVSLQQDPKITDHDFQINAQMQTTSPVMPETSAIVSPDHKNHNAKIPREAYFVIGGASHFPLDKPVINIGRHSDNDLVLDDAHISRHHAQMRVINQRFVIFDIGSTGGIYLNGRKITQASLQTGDVVRIGLINLIYIQETSTTNQTIAISAGEVNIIDTGDHTGGDRD